MQTDNHERFRQLFGEVPFEERRALNDSDSTALSPQIKQHSTCSGSHTYSESNFKTVI